MIGTESTFTDRYSMVSNTSFVYLRNAKRSIVEEDNVVQLQHLTSPHRSTQVFIYSLLPIPSHLSSSSFSPKLVICSCHRQPDSPPRLVHTRLSIGSSKNVPIWFSASQAATFRPLEGLVHHHHRDILRQ